MQSIILFFKCRSCLRLRMSMARITINGKRMHFVPHTHTHFTIVPNQRICIYDCNNMVIYALPKFCSYQSHCCCSFWFYVHKYRAYKTIKSTSFRAHTCEHTQKCYEFRRNAWKCICRVQWKSGLRALVVAFNPFEHFQWPHITVCGV